jgi:hypothetical protein
MASLSKALRKDLARAVTKARFVADSGARKAIETLAVGRPEPWPNTSDDQKRLRNRLRAHGRQLGDVIDERKTQTIDHLALECAYEQWHRMLFARFLAENDLLIEPQSGVPIALDECRELALERDMDWIALASQFAVRMLSQIFRPDDPVLDIVLSPETRHELEEILEGLPREIFTANDSLGWVYQFWQADRKDAINESGGKIGADELPAVTQLFTEDYMVLFLLHNTLGAWWAGKVLVEQPELATSAQDEQTLRDACAMGDVHWTYLRFIREDPGGWRPAAGTFATWPRLARDITVLDPSMGSGHFLVFALPILAAIRAKEESLSKADAILAVLRDNLHGLELDPRCTQIAAFNLALATWKAVGHCLLPPLRLACSGLSIAATEKEWAALAGTEWRGTMGQLHALFKQAPILGSLIDPKRVFGDLFSSTFDAIRPALKSALEAEHESDEQNELAISAQGLLEAADLLLGEFTLVVTNVPYLGRGKQDDVLKEYCDKRHPRAKADLSTSFVERCLSFCGGNGSTALVTPQNWLFLGTYKHLRESLLRNDVWHLVAKLGPNAFQDMNWWAATTALVVLSGSAPTDSSIVRGLDVSSVKDQFEKATLLCGRSVRSQSSGIDGLPQSDVLRNPDARVALSLRTSLPLLSNYADAVQGLTSSDNLRFIQLFWEQASLGMDWLPIQGASVSGALSSGRESILLWERGEGELVRVLGKGVKGRPVWGRRGVAVGQMRTLPVSPYCGTPFDMTCAVLVAKDTNAEDALWSYCSSPDFLEAVRRVDQKLNVTNATLVKVPFDLQLWQTVASERHPQGVPKPDVSTANQWLFTGDPCGSEQALQVAVARLLAYKWPRQNGLQVLDHPPIESDGLERHADEAGIVCLMPLRGQRSAADRLRSLLAEAFGAGWTTDRVATLLRDAGFASRSLEDWLRDGFFEQHRALFHQTPFIWHIWDGLTNGFHALVNYHRLAAPNGEGRRTLERLIHTYLGRDWIEQQRHDQKNGVEGADERVAAAEHLRSELTKVLEGEPPYDLFVRWKTLSAQPVGWEPDINDGIRSNIRPFMAASTFNGKSIFRVAPKIKWGKDRGREPTRVKEDYPWFWSWDGTTEDFAGGTSFDGNRWNDLHYTRAFKAAARKRASRP